MFIVIPTLRLNSICPNAASHTCTSVSADSCGVSSVLTPSIAPGSVTANITITSIITNSSGINILLNFPIPSFRSLCDMYHIRNHTITVAISTYIAM